jgi:hypothetical protein
VDFEKAFDSVEWPFIQRALRLFGFKNDFCKWVNLFHTDITSSVTNNGHNSYCFSQNHGVRQGDLLSPYLFILVVEILSAALKINPDIKGIKLDESEYLISQLADDTTIFLDGSENSLRNCLLVLDKLCECSGLKANVDKTEAIWLGSKLRYTGKVLDWNSSGIFVLLGIRFCLFDNCIVSQNYELHLDKIKTLLNNWMWRPLSVMGKIAIVKSLALSKLVYLFMVLPNPTND